MSGTDRGYATLHTVLTLSMALPTRRYYAMCAHDSIAATNTLTLRKLPKSIFPYQYRTSHVVSQWMTRNLNIGHHCVGGKRLEARARRMITNISAGHRIQRVWNYETGTSLDLRLVPASDVGRKSLAGGFN
eukprot:3121377-Rhodomonas_salina.5